MPVAEPARRGVQPYFAYGSNMLSRRLHQRCPSAEELGVARLAGHELRFDKRSWKDGSGKCHVLPIENEESSVWGALYRIDPVEVPRLDAAEGLGKGYEVRSVVVETSERGALSAFTYFAEPGYVDPALGPFCWYVDLVVAGALEHELPVDYVKRFRDARPVRDPDRARAAEERGLLQ